MRVRSDLLWRDQANGTTDAVVAAEAAGAWLCTPVITAPVKLSPLRRHRFTTVPRWFAPSSSRALSRPRYVQASCPDERRHDVLNLSDERFGDVFARCDDHSHARKDSWS
jgi:hypothetical protein